ncbi:Ribosomal RNA small subunit methyltransferase D [Leminorella richardii]|uniref:Ribosomal RNA small subunit methyltransferase D n=1 Tax=Leminorella richardii TaxID=158841 RepID=A0A2X4U430_9GAMM|nr:16S rRNA (guanine(966)-N(2))-methyltransferase [Leminorella richardii]SQI34577.1 Ribosomal RNA small subunit methyltransferase D [Leminorella richardii]
MSKKSSPSKAGQIRIIAGQWRGRKLPVPDSPGLRPTTDRVKETLFNWLAPVLQEARCLDCFAGSGSLGFEALSRYAEQVVMLEAERSVAQGLQKNLALLNARGGQVVHTDTLSWLKGSPSPFDVVFLDPPFRQGLLAETVSLLEQRGWLAEEAWIYVETESESAAVAVPPTWQLHREKVAGQVAYRLYQRQPLSAPQHTEQE